MNRLRALLCGCDQIAKQVAGVLSEITGRWIKITTSVTTTYYKHPGGDICYEFRLAEKVGDYQDADLLCEWVPKEIVAGYTSNRQILYLPCPRELDTFNRRGALRLEEMEWLKSHWPRTIFEANKTRVEFDMR